MSNNPYTTVLVHRPPEWTKQALCAKQSDKDLWFSDEKNPEAKERRAAATAICAACPVRKQCLTEALVNPPEHGIWAGQLPRKVLAMAVATSTPRQPTREELYDQGATDQQIATALGMTNSGIMNWRVRRGLPINYSQVKGTRLTDEQNAARLADWESGLSDVELSKRWNLSCHGVISWRTYRGLDANRRRRQAS